MDNLDIKISEYYDNELINKDLIDFEIKMANSAILSEYVNEKYMNNYLISKSLIRVKNKLSQHQCHFL